MISTDVFHFKFSSAHRFLFKFVNFPDIISSLVPGIRASPNRIGIKNRK